MRTIKFRGKAQDGKYYCGDLIHIDNVPNIRMCEGSNTYYIDVYPETVAQLVGYDADGNEVYEGDQLIRLDGVIGFLVPDVVTDYPDYKLAR